MIIKVTIELTCTADIIHMRNSIPPEGEFNAGDRPDYDQANQGASNDSPTSVKS